MPVVSAERAEAGSVQDRERTAGRAGGTGGGGWGQRAWWATCLAPSPGAACSVLATARSDLVFLAGGVQKSPAEGGDVPDGLSARAVPSHALRDGCLHARDRHAG